MFRPTLIEAWTYTEIKYKNWEERINMSSKLSLLLGKQSQHFLPSDRTTSASGITASPASKENQYPKACAR